MKLPSLRPDLAEPVRRWAKELRQLAQASGAQSQRQLAKRLNIAPATVRRYLTGERLPERELVTQLIELVQADRVVVDESVAYRLHVEAQHFVATQQLRHQDDGSTARSSKDNVSLPGDHRPAVGPAGDTSIQRGGPTAAAADQTPPRSFRFPARVLRSMTRRDLVIGAGTAVLGAFAGVGATWVFAPGQEVRAQRAVQEDQKAQASEKSPLRVKVAERWRIEDTFGWVLPNLLTPDQESRLLRTSDATDPATWITGAGGVRIGSTLGGGGFTFSRLRLAIECQWIKPVLVTEIRARVRRSPPLSGALVWVGSEGGDEVVEIGFNLEEDDPVARVRVEDQKLGEPYTDRHAITLEPGEIVPLDISAQATRHYCEWDIEFTVQVDGAERTILVNNGGNPFRTTAFADRYGMKYFYDIQPPGRWYSAGPGGLQR